MGVQLCPCSWDDGHCQLFCLTVERQLDDFMSIETKKRRKWKRLEETILKDEFKKYPSQQMCTELMKKYKSEGLFTDRTIKDIQKKYLRLVKK